MAREVCPDLPQDTRSVLSTLYRKAQAYEAGEKIEFNGRTYPPLYTPRNSTLMELFDITDEEGKRLKTIITKEEAVRRHRERDRLSHRQRDRALGAVDRETYLATVKETAEQRRAQARLLRARGIALQQIAEMLEVSLDTVKTYLYR